MCKPCIRSRSSRNAALRHATSPEACCTCADLIIARATVAMRCTCGLYVRICLLACAKSKATAHVHVDVVLASGSCSSKPVKFMYSGVAWHIYDHERARMLHQWVPHARDLRPVAAVLHVRQRSHFPNDEVLLRTEQLRSGGLPWGSVERFIVPHDHGTADSGSSALQRLRPPRSNGSQHARRRSSSHKWPPPRARPPT